MSVARSNVEKLCAFMAMRKRSALFGTSDCNLSATFAASWGILRSIVRLTFISQLIKLLENGMIPSEYNPKTLSSNSLLDGWVNQLLQSMPNSMVTHVAIVNCFRAHLDHSRQTYKHLLSAEVHMF
ncbi:hypothetical protein LINGRAHAP2_LOCUS9413 [Linum grandiflorum]